MSTRILAACAGFAAVFFLTASVAVAGPGEPQRGGGVQLTVPEDWTRVARVSDPPIEEPRTLLVVGTKGARPTESECLIASYRVPADGAVVVVVGWRESVGTTGLLPLSGLKLRRETFACFTGRGAVAQLTRGGRDFQVSVMVGDRASAKTVDEALDVARSFALVPRS
ncbi:MAG: hypothetical protein ACRC50_07570 [Gaiella sp.]